MEKSGAIEVQYMQTRPPQGLSIEQFIKTEIPIPEDFDLNIPTKFLKLATDELADIGRKRQQL